MKTYLKLNFEQVEFFIIFYVLCVYLVNETQLSKCQFLLLTMSQSSGR